MIVQNLPNKYHLTNSIFTGIKQHLIKVFIYHSGMSFEWELEKMWWGCWRNQIFFNMFWNQKFWWTREGFFCRQSSNLEKIWECKQTLNSLCFSHFLKFDLNKVLGLPWFQIKTKFSTDYFTILGIFWYKPILLVYVLNITFYLLYNMRHWWWFEEFKSDNLGKVQTFQVLNVRTLLSPNFKSDLCSWLKNPTQVAVGVRCTIGLKAFFHVDGVGVGKTQILWGIYGTEPIQIYCKLFFQTIFEMFFGRFKDGPQKWSKNSQKMTWNTAWKWSYNSAFISPQLRETSWLQKKSLSVRNLRSNIGHSLAAWH